MIWVTVVLALMVVVLLGRELARRWAAAETNLAPTSVTGAASVAHRPPRTPVPGRAPTPASPMASVVSSSAQALPPAHLHRHESVLGGATTDTATTLFVVRVERTGRSAAKASPIALAMLAGSRLVDATRPQGRVTHWRDGMFLVTADDLRDDEATSWMERIRAAVADTPLVDSAGGVLPVTCTVCFARFAPGDPALEAASLDAMVARTPSLA